MKVFACWAGLFLEYRCKISRTFPSMILIQSRPLEPTEIYLRLSFSLSKSRFKTSGAEKRPRTSLAMIWQLFEIFYALTTARKLHPFMQMLTRTQLRNCQH